MPDFKSKTPVVFIIFKRPDLTEKVFEAIRQFKPSKLLIIADAPREGIPGEAESCAEARAVIDRVDWDCEVLKNYADNNLGCAKRVSSGLNWAFEQVSEAIIIEDDCLPDPSFFRYCQELLEYYRDDQRVMSISGTNFHFDTKVTDYSYYHSCYHDSWGWATWKRAWQHFDFDMKLWPSFNRNNFLQNKLVKVNSVKYWTKYFQMTYEGNKDSWLYRWLFSCWTQSGLTVIPNVNLVSNLGHGLEGTHTVHEDSPFANQKVEAMPFPLVHPPFVARNKQADRLQQKTRFDVEDDIVIRIQKKIKKIKKKMIVN